MKHPRKRRWLFGLAAGGFAAIVIAAIIAAAFAQGHEYKRLLSGGYYVFAADGTVTVGTPDRFRHHPSNCQHGRAVGMLIDRIAAVDHLIVGHVVSTMDRNPSDVEAPGYFIINTSTGLVEKELSEDAWRTALAGHGVSAPPPLGKPESVGEPEHRFFNALR